VQYFEMKYHLHKPATTFYASFFSHSSDIDGNIFEITKKSPINSVIISENIN